MGLLKGDYCSIVPFYQDRMAGIYLFNKLKEMNCPTIWCDGRFKEFEQINDSDLSTDGFREIIEKDDSMMLIDCPALEVQEKWSMMFKTAGDLGYKYCFLWGCDEMPMGDFDEVLKNLPEHDPDRPQLYRLMMIEQGKQGFWKDYDGPKERIFFRPDLIEVRESHWAFFDKTYVDGYPLLSPPLGEKGLIFYHSNKVRSNERDAMMTAYQKVRVPGERSRTMQAIVDNSHNKQLTLEILKEIYPDKKCIEEKTYDDRQAFRVLGGTPNVQLFRDQFQAYVCLPTKEGLYIRKAVVARPDTKGNIKVLNSGAII